MCFSQHLVVKHYYETNKEFSRYLFVRSLSYYQLYVPTLLLLPILLSHYKVFDIKLGWIPSII